MENEKSYEIFEKIENMLVELNSKMPDGLNTAFQQAYDRWAWLHLRMSFIKNAF